MFESMTVGLPVILGIEGHAREILKASEVAVNTRPEDPKAMLDVVQHLKGGKDLCGRTAVNETAYVRDHYHCRDTA